MQFPVSYFKRAWPYCTNLRIHRRHVHTDGYWYSLRSTPKSEETSRRPSWYWLITSSRMSCEYEFPPWLGCFFSPMKVPRGLCSWGCCGGKLLSMMAFPAVDVSKVVGNSAAGGCWQWEAAAEVVAAAAAPGGQRRRQRHQAARSGCKRYSLGRQWQKQQKGCAPQRQQRPGCSLPQWPILQRITQRNALKLLPMSPISSSKCKMYWFLQLKPQKDFYIELRFFTEGT